MSQLTQNRNETIANAKPVDTIFLESVKAPQRDVENASVMMNIYPITRRNGASLVE